MMSRERLMEGRGREHPRRRFTRVAKVHIEDARPGSVDRRILVTRKGSTAFEKGRHTADLNLCAGEIREEARRTPAHTVELRSEAHKSQLQSLMRNSDSVFRSNQKIKKK